MTVHIWPTIKGAARHVCLRDVWPPPSKLRLGRQSHLASFHIDQAQVPPLLREYLEVSATSSMYSLRLLTVAFKTAVTLRSQGPTTPSHMFQVRPPPSAVMSLDSAIGYLTSAMENPSSAHSACHMRMCTAGERLEEAFNSCTTFNDRNKLAKSHPKFLRAAIRFLTHKQTVAEHADMVKDLCSCRCDLENRTIFMQHLGGKKNRWASNKNEQLLHAVFHVGTWICAVLRGTTKSKFKLGQLSKASATAAWPASPEDLLPYGPADSVDGLQLWVMEPGADGIYLVATALVEFYQPFAEANFRAPDYVFALERPLQYIEEAMEPYVRNPNDPRAALHLERTRFIHLFLRAHLLNNYSGRFVNMLVFKKERAYPVMNKLWGLVAGRPLDDEIRSGTALIRDLCKFEFHPRTGEPYLPAGQTMDAADTIPGPSNEVEDALSHMYQVRSGGCLNPTCKSNRDGVTTRLCGRCSIVRYCGEEVGSSFHASRLQTC